MSQWAWVAIYSTLAVGSWVLLVWLVLRCAKDHQTDHAKCIAHVSSVTSNRVVALALYEAADHFDSVDGEAELTRIRNNYRTETFDNRASVPAIWLRERADRIGAGQ